MAKLVGAPRQTVCRWLNVLREQGIDGPREMSKGGRPSLVTAGQVAELRELLLAGPIASGYGTDLWTLKPVRLLIETRAITRNADGVAQWKKRTLSALKREPGEKAT